MRVFKVVSPFMAGCSVNHLQAVLFSLLLILFFCSYIGQQCLPLISTQKIDYCPTCSKGYQCIPCMFPLCIYSYQGPLFFHVCFFLYHVEDARTFYLTSTSGPALLAVLGRLSLKRHHHQTNQPEKESIHFL